MLIERKEYFETDNTLGYIESIFDSENIIKTTYFPEKQKLYIAFNRGDTYSYDNVNLELFQEFENNDSQGKFFYKNIKNNKTYLARKEFTLYPNEIKELNEIVNNKLNNNENE